LLRLGPGRARTQSTIHFSLRIAPVEGVAGTTGFAGNCGCRKSRSCW